MLNKSYLENEYNSIWREKPIKNELKRKMHKEILKQRDQHKLFMNFDEFESLEACILVGDQEKVEHECNIMLSQIREELSYDDGVSLVILKKNFTHFLGFAVRAAIKGGAIPEEIYHISEIYMEKIEQSVSYMETEILIELFVVDLTYKVNLFRHKTEKVISPPIRKAKKYIRKNVCVDVSLNELGDQVSLSPSYLSNLFKNEVGMTISQYKQKVKIEEACQLLAFSEYSLSEISENLGFCTQSYFSIVFNKHMGVTPKVYRQEHMSVV